ncbi:MAG: hypothetical protein VX563_00360, partial [Planctomycetota bacterium]|nr:hypothetical protein [Planctomycetota bacterium]
MVEALHLRLRGTPAEDFYLLELTDEGATFQPATVSSGQVELVATDEGGAELAVFEMPMPVAFPNGPVLTLPADEEAAAFLEAASGTGRLTVRGALDNDRTSASFRLAPTHERLNLAVGIYDGTIPRIALGWYSDGTATHEFVAGEVIQVGGRRARVAEKAEFSDTAEQALLVSLEDPSLAPIPLDPVPDGLDAQWLGQSTTVWVAVERDGDSIPMAFRTSQWQPATAGAYLSQGYDGRTLASFQEEDDRLLCMTATLEGLAANAEGVVEVPISGSSRGPIGLGHTVIDLLHSSAHVRLAGTAPALLPHYALLPYGEEHAYDPRPELLVAGSTLRECEQVLAVHRPFCFLRSAVDPGLLDLEAGWADRAPAVLEGDVEVLLECANVGGRILVPGEGDYDPMIQSETR